MERRLDLNRKLREILGSDYVYFNPPENVKIHYPCIIYNRENSDHVFANNKMYQHYKQYQITVIDRNPDSDISDRLLTNLEYCSFNRFYVYDELNHWVLRLFY